MVKPARKVRIGNKLIFNENISCDVIDNTVSGGRVLRFEYNGENLIPLLIRMGFHHYHHILRETPSRRQKKLSNCLCI